jgi:hypothetical protein
MINEEDIPISFVCSLLNIEELNKPKRFILNSILWNPEFNYTIIILDNIEYKLFSTGLYNTNSHEYIPDNMNLPVDIICNEYNEDETIVDILLDDKKVLLSFSVINQNNIDGSTDSYLIIDRSCIFYKEIIKEFWSHIPEFVSFNMEEFSNEKRD